MATFTVRFELEIKAETPRQAAIVARDTLLDPDSVVLCDVHDMLFIKEADDWFTNENHGWQVRFGERGVTPVGEPVEWYRAEG